MTLGYDNLDRLTQEITPQSTVSYTYDAVGRRTSMTVVGQPTVNYAYDNADRLTSITQGSAVVSFTYDNANRRTSLTLPNGLVTEYSYAAASRLTGLTYKEGSTTIGTLTYGYNAAGERVQTGGTWARTGQPNAMTGATYNAANHQLTFGSQTLTYDLNGNLTSDGTNTYYWNARNQLVAINGTSVASFSYDAFGRRAQKTVDGMTTSFVYDGLTPIQELNGANITNLLTGLSVDEYFTRSNATGTHHVLADILGSTVALANGTGAVDAQYTYEAFGNVSATGTTNGNPFSYTGREADGTGLAYYRARYYNPQLQRFVSEDPIGFAGEDTNLYSYVFNDPMSSIDPLGLGKIGATIKIVKRVGHWLRESRFASMRQAQNTIRRGGDVIAPTKQTARAIAEGAANKGEKVIHHEAHKKGYRSHYHILGKPGHIFYGAIPGADLGSMIGRKTGSRLLGQVVDFFNPLSDVQELLDFLNSLSEREPEDTGETAP